MEHHLTAQRDQALKVHRRHRCHGAAMANRLNGTHRPRSLLSGLLVCGCCGGPKACSNLFGTFLTRQLDVIHSAHRDHRRLGQFYF
jgi:hypothetical protein